MSGPDRRPPPVPLQLGLRVATAALRAMGPGRYALADAAGTAAWALSAQRRRRAAAHHRRLDPALSEPQARRLARRSFCEMTRSGVDFVWACGMDPERSLAHATLAGIERCRAAESAGRGGILALTHFGNWDMAANVANGLGLRLTTVMAPLGPPAVTSLVVWARTRNMLEVLVPNGARHGLVDALHRNRFVAILCDVVGGGATVDVEYCGGRVPFSRTPAELAIEAGAPLLPTASWREDGLYHVVALDTVTAGPGDDVRSLMQRVASAVEPVVRSHPEQWYPFRRVYADEERD